MPHYTALLASACEIVGQVDEAVTLLNDALQIAERTGECWFAAELNRHKGPPAAAAGVSGGRRGTLLQSPRHRPEPGSEVLGIARCVSLARLRRDQGCRREASELLAPVYSWFTEGFGTPDLKDAKALLNELNTWLTTLLAITTSAAKVRIWRRQEACQSRRQTVCLLRQC